MANPEHVEIVLQGVDAIDEWRISHPGQILDLAQADLSLSNLFRCNLSGADLSGSDLYSADLSYADLTGANLAGAQLFSTNLLSTELAGVNLSGADLSFTHFQSLSFDQVRIQGALCGQTIFADCDLSSALGLESVDHQGPSSIGVDTIVESGGNIPEVFLRGCGVPDSIITYVRSLVAEPIQFYTCFISYAHQDQAFADRMYADLQAKGVRCWYYPESATMGRRVWEDIDRSIKVYDKLVVICSHESLNSPAVVREIERALDKEDAIAKDNARRKSEAAARGEEPRLKDPDVLFPIRIDDFVLNGWEHHRKHNITSRNIGDFSGWDTDVQKYQDSLNRLLHALDPKSWPAVGSARSHPTPTKR
ncbi:MAG: hypothetical protein BZY80_04780 [SAR202 cluster bacterium Io17-Chloro-G2]|nr:MAG: hypothetical protein BZY80_04780 [SAR202 cluster bacterium Io17-Chloro-G2]